MDSKDLGDKPGGPKKKEKGPMFLDFSKGVNKKNAGDGDPKVSQQNLACSLII